MSERNLALPVNEIKVIPDIYIFQVNTPQISAGVKFFWYRVFYSREYHSRARIYRFFRDSMKGERQQSPYGLFPLIDQIW